MNADDFPHAREAASLRDLQPRMQPGYYPGFQVLTQQKFWDDATRAVVLKRVETQPEIRFFSGDERCFWECVFEHIIPQEDRVPERRIPIVPHVDARLFEGRTAGYRFADMPHDGDAYRLGMQAIDVEAQASYHRAFLACAYHERELLLGRLHDGKPQAAAHIWKNMSVQRFWELLLGDAGEAYYSHPWAWDEIGFGGPAYPRGYMRLEHGEPEPWEKREQRYSWAPPAESLSAYSGTEQIHD